MNDYTTPGNYFCSTTSNAGTLLNCPVSYAFTLKVFLGTGLGYPIQEFIPLQGNVVYTRYYDNIQKIWSSYDSFTNDVELMSEKNFSSLTTSSKTIIGAINEINGKI